MQTTNDNTAPTDQSTSPSPSDNSQNQNPNDQQGEFLLTLQTELEESKNRLNELTRISQQALADLQNFKKRTEEEKTRFLAFANASLISDLLPVLDNIDRATTHLPEDPSAKEWAQGILGILKQMEQILQDKGLTVIDTNNQNFDPNFHEALLTTDGPNELIIKELEKGYKLGDKVIRRAKVTVGHGENNTSTTDNN